MYRITRDQEGDDLDLTLFLDKSSARHRWLRGDWYGLRFLALCHDLSSHGDRPLARWEPAAQRLAVPVEHRWPAAYEQALVMAAGALPALSDDGQWLLYPSIPAPLRDLLANKLGVEVLPEVCDG
jgi:hypothetical protein